MQRSQLLALPCYNVTLFCARRPIGKPMGVEIMKSLIFAASLLFANAAFAQDGPIDLTQTAAEITEEVVEATEVSAPLDAPLTEDGVDVLEVEADLVETTDEIDVLDSVDADLDMEVQGEDLEMEIEYVFPDETPEATLSPAVALEERLPSDTELRWLEKLAADAERSQKRYEDYAISMGTIEADLASAPDLNQEIPVAEVIAPAPAPISQMMLDIDVNQTNTGGLASIIAVADEITETFHNDGSREITAKSGSETTTITIVSTSN